MTIRNEVEADFRQVEELTRQAFWNLNCPGCMEHFVAHQIRKHADFIPELDFVLEVDNRIVANVMYTKSKLVGKNGEQKEILTFGPLSVLPEFQRKGYGTAILNASFQKAIELGFDAIVIFGNPENYICHGFKSCKKYDVAIEDGIFPTALLVKELCPHAIPKGNWIFRESPAFDLNEQDAQAFDQTFEPLEKGFQKSQELFFIYSHSQIF